MGIVRQPHHQLSVRGADCALTAVANNVAVSSDRGADKRRLRLRQSMTRGTHLVLR
jgi:hypothetical protein